MLTVWETILEPKPTAGFFWQEELPSLRYRGDIFCWWRFNSIHGEIQVKSAIKHIAPGTNEIVQPSSFLCKQLLGLTNQFSQSLVSWVLS